MILSAASDNLNNVKEKLSKNLGAPLAILAGVCWGVISIFIRRLNAAGMDSFKIISYRAIVSVVILFIYMIITDRNLLKVKLKDIWVFLGSGILSLTFFSYCYFTSIIKSGAAISVVLLYTSPIFVMVISLIFFREKMTLKKTIAVVMTFTGCALVSGALSDGGIGASIGFDGLLLGLGAGFGYALYSLFAKIALDKGYASITISFYTFLFSGIALLILKGPGFIFEKGDLESAIWIIGVAVICTVVPYLAYTAGMKRIEVSRAAVLVTVEPLVGALLGMIAYNEPAGPARIIGIIMILISVVMLA